MRFALIGYTGHWTTYETVIREIPGAVLAAVAPATEEETAGGFDHAPGYGMETKRYDSPEALLAAEKLDFVQVCCRPDRAPRYTLECLRRRLPVVCEKPLAMDLPTLAQLWKASARVPLTPMHTQRSEPWLHAARQAVRGGAVGQPLVSYHQKSYRWGDSRPDWYRSRRTFPGLAPYAGIHAFDWLVWVLGGAWEEVAGWEHAGRPDYPACASHGEYVLRGADGQVATVSVDYLRPAGAPTHGDERLRVAGTGGLLEVGPRAGLDVLVRGSEPPVPVPPTRPDDWYVRFVRSLRGGGEPLIPRGEAFRATEIALKAQRAADTGKPQDLGGSAYR